MARAERLLVGLMLSLPALLPAADLAGQREAQFMQACLRDATVPAARREALCTCVREAFAYSSDTRFGQSDLLTLAESVWEAPDRRLPRDTLGMEARRIRQGCLLKTAR